MLQGKLTVEQLAERWKLSPATIRRYIRQEKLATGGTRGLGRFSGWLIDLSEIERFEREVLGW